MGSPEQLRAAPGLGQKDNVLCEFASLARRSLLLIACRSAGWTGLLVFKQAGHEDEFVFHALPACRTLWQQAPAAEVLATISQ